MKKIVIKKTYKNHLGQNIEVTEEITSDSAKFHKVFDNLTELCKKQLVAMDFFDAMIHPSDN